MTLNKLFLFLFLIALSPDLSSEQLLVTAQKGDGIYAILRRYQLLDYTCNLNEFYRLNKLKNNAALMIGSTYKLPIEVLNFDGKSIRSSTGNDNYARALAIQHYNEALLAAEVRPEDFRENKVLYLPFHIDNCFEEKLEAAPAEIMDEGEIAKTGGKPGAKPQELEQVTTSAFRTFDIFGEKYAYVPKIDNKLAGRIFYIVSGHGGPDPGTIGKRAGHHLHEDEYAYDVALRMTRNILAHGGTPYMIVRDTDGIRDERYLKGDKDETVWGGQAIPYQQKARLQQRTNIINTLYEEHLAKGITDQTMISIHVDSRAKNKKIDLFFYHHDTDLVGARQAEKMQAVVRKKYDQVRKGRGYAGTVGTRDLHVLREAMCSGVFIELGNITNSSDQVRIVEPSNRQLIADWLVEGLFN
ncbi:N-acetylmuramoyl-L-alanine amidase [Neolewinella aurantiaca]|uniref:N-acetylmuramoyl-L-alanine amidase n=1 Tax=Neolewinella aurantiaca TaxID=2602767 RepID=A0A5C7FM33_9BACT|nr:N-acetylmuramoyl-L-alanine amidase [Neolewinella aurantiaca]TXF91128.1 N-acetylmuramoyl-L-alanine amidase [Neolewinella aurantiaca]